MVRPRAFLNPDEKFGGGMLAGILNPINEGWPLVRARHVNAMSLAAEPIIGQLSEFRLFRHRQI